MSSISKLDEVREMICGVTSADKSTAIVFRRLLQSALPENSRSGSQSVLFAAAIESFADLLAAIALENEPAIRTGRDHALASISDLERIFA